MAIKYSTNVYEAKIPNIDLWIISSQPMMFLQCITLHTHQKLNIRLYVGD